MRSLKVRVETGEESENTAEAWDQETFDKMSKHMTLVERLSRTVCGEHARAARPVNEELLRVQSVITAALPEDESKDSEAIYDMLDDFSVDTSFESPGLMAGTSSDQDSILLVVLSVLLLALVNVFESSFTVRCCLLSHFALLRFCSVVRSIKFRFGSGC